MRGFPLTQSRIVNEISGVTGYTYDFSGQGCPWLMVHGDDISQFPAAVCIIVLIGIGVFFSKNNRQNQSDRQDSQAGQDKTESERETAQTETLNEDKESNSLPNTENNVYDKKIVESS